MWDNRERAQHIMIRQSDLRNEIDSYEALKKQTEDTIELLEMADDSMMNELSLEANKIDKAVDRLELATPAFR